jgi:hypothetical protein
LRKYTLEGWKVYHIIKHPIVKKDCMGWVPFELLKNTGLHLFLQSGYTGHVPEFSSAPSWLDIGQVT